MAFRIGEFETADELTRFANNAKKVTAAAKVAGGQGYSLNDMLTVVGGNGSSAVLKVTGVAAGAVTTVSVEKEGGYLTVPTNPVSTSGPGTGATFNLTTAAAVVGQSNVQSIWARAGKWYLEYWT